MFKLGESFFSIISIGVMILLPVAIITDLFKQVDHKYSTAIILFLSVVLNVSVLFEVWSCGDIGNKFYIIGGLIPFSDALGYLNGARYLIEYGELLELSCYRPIASAFYAILLKITGQNLQLTLLLCTFLVGISVYYLSRTILKIFGFSTGLLSMLLLSYYFIGYNGTFMTEPVGFLFGNLAMALLLNGVFNKNFSVFLFGLFMVSFALSTRSGAMFLIPTLVLFSSLFFFKKSERWKSLLKTFSISCISCIMALSVSPFLLNFIGSSDGYNFQGNFAFTLYGIVKGGKDWTQFRTDHPHLLRTLDKNEIYDKAYEISKNEFFKDPLPFFQSIFSTIGSILINPFKFFADFDLPLPYFLLLIIFIFTFIGLYTLRKKQHFRVLLFYLTCCFGILISAPFLILVGNRIYAATMAINCSVIALGLGVIIFLLKDQFNKSVKDEKEPSNIVVNNNSLVLFTILLVSVNLIAPILIKYTAQHIRVVNEGNAEPCRENELTIRNVGGNYIEITEELSTFLPLANIERLHSSIQKSNRVKKSMFFFAPFNLNKDDKLASYVLMEENVFNKDEEFINICTENSYARFRMFDAYEKSNPPYWAKQVVELEEGKLKGLSYNEPEWLEIKEVFTDDEFIESIDGGSWNSATIKSKNTLERLVSGSLTFNTKQVEGNIMLGLCQPYKSIDYGRIDYSFHLRSNGKLYVYENGKSQGEFGEYSIQDTFRIDKINNRIVYIVNDKIIFESPKEVTSDLLIAASFYNPSIKISDVRSSF